MKLRDYIFSITLIVLIGVLIGVLVAFPLFGDTVQGAQRCSSIDVPSTDVAVGHALVETGAYSGGVDVDIGVTAKTRATVLSIPTLASEFACIDRNHRHRFLSEVGWSI